jgi:hypothetical protein
MGVNVLIHFAAMCVVVGQCFSDVSLGEAWIRSQHGMDVWLGLPGHDHRSDGHARAPDHCLAAMDAWVVDDARERCMFCRSHDLLLSEYRSEGRVPGQTYMRTSDSATIAGRSPPSISMVWTLVIWKTPGLTSSNAWRVVRILIRAPTLTGEMKRTRFRP